MSTYKIRSKRSSYKYKYKKRKLMNSGYQALKEVRELKKLWRPEYKVSTDGLSQAVSSTAVIDEAISLIQQGNLKVNRDGNQIRVTEIHLKVKMTQHASTTSNFLRVMIVLDKQCNGIKFGLSDLLDDTQGIPITQYRELDQTDRFHVFCDKMMTTTNDGGDNAWFEYHNMKVNFVMKYDASTGAITDLTSNCLFLLFVSDQTTNTPTVVSNFRIRYVDF